MLVQLCNHYLAEAAKFSNPRSNCVLAVSGSANFKPGTDFFRSMKAGVESDIPLIQDYVLRKYKSAENFNKAVEDAIVRLSPWSLLYQGRYREAFQACEAEIEALKRLPGDNSKSLSWKHHGKNLWRFWLPSSLRRFSI